MTSFEETITIQAPPSEVFAVLDDIAGISEWNPGVQQSTLLGDRSGGLGATRSCDLGGGKYLHEEVVLHETNLALTMRITGTNLPFARADIAFRLRPDGTNTIVTVAPDYALKFGPVGRLLDALFVRRTYRRGMASLLSGLRRRVESSRTADHG